MRASTFIRSKRVASSTPLYSHLTDTGFVLPQPAVSKSSISRASEFSLPEKHYLDPNFCCSGPLLTSSSQLTPMFVKMPGNLSAFQSLGRQMARHYLLGSLTTFSVFGPLQTDCTSTIGCFTKHGAFCKMTKTCENPLLIAGCHFTPQIFQIFMS